MTEIEQIELFERDLKRIRKDCREIDYCISVFIDALVVRLPNRLTGTERIPLGYEYQHCPIFKTRVYCKRCKETSIRLVYAYKESSALVTLIEIYRKNEKANHDVKRIRDFIKSKS